jgi:hypothetical protein
MSLFGGNIGLDHRDGHPTDILEEDAEIRQFGSQVTLTPSSCGSATARSSHYRQCAKGAADRDCHETHEEHNGEQRRRSELSAPTVHAREEWVQDQPTSYD